LAGSANCMRLSSKKAAHVAIVGAAQREIREVRIGKGIGRGGGG